MSTSTIDFAALPELPKVRAFNGVRGFDVTCVYRRGVWAAVLHPDNERRAEVLHLPSGNSVTDKSLSPEDAITLCRVFAEHAGDWQAASEFGAELTLTRVTRDRLIAEVNRLGLEFS